jgi:Holliday junction resolvasome RuvABC endonuclease subunit
MATKEFNGGLKNAQEVAIGIDQSLTGFAFSAVAVDSPQNHMTWVYKSPYRGVQRLDDIQRFLMERFEWLSANKNSIRDIAMEAPFMGSPSTLPLSELAATVKLFLYGHFYFDEPKHLRTPLVIPPMTLKKYASGKGNAKKQEMLLMIFKRWGVEFLDDNAADAYALARLAGGLHIDATESKVIEQVTDPKFRDFIE